MNEDTASAADYWRELYDEAEADEQDTDPYAIDQASPLGWGYYWIKAMS